MFPPTNTTPNFLLPPTPRTKSQNPTSNSATTTTMLRAAVRRASRSLLLTATGPHHTPLTSSSTAAAAANQYRIFEIFSDMRAPPRVNNFSRGIATMSEAAVSSTDADESIEEAQNLLEQQITYHPSQQQQQHQNQNRRPRPQRQRPHGMSPGKYQALRRRQVRIETEAWEQAAKEYRELLADMCEQKLAPNLPYVKSLFLGWFEPLRDQITAEQELVADVNSRASHGPYIRDLPADMIAVITMHKLMGLLMTGSADGSVRVVQAACQIGEAIEHEVRIHRFLEKTKKKTNKEENKGEEEGDAEADRKQQFLRKKVTGLMKMQKLRQVRNIVKGQDDSKPWGQDAQAKVGCRLIELLMDTAYIQPPVSQSNDGPPDIRPAFKHSLRNVAKDQQSRRYGVIECDPLVRQGLDRTARHMVIPYMPMLIPPVNWTGYDRGAHLFLPSYIMRTHGAKQQREAVKRTTKQQLQSVFEALNTLGSTKWRINKRVLSIVDRIWSSGGRLGDLVDRADIPLPEEPDHLVNQACAG